MGVETESVLKCGDFGCREEVKGILSIPSITPEEFRSQPERDLRITNYVPALR